MRTILWFAKRFVCIPCDSQYRIIPYVQYHTYYYCMSRSILPVSIYRSAGYWYYQVVPGTSLFLYSTLVLHTAPPPARWMDERQTTENRLFLRDCPRTHDSFFSSDVSSGYYETIRPFRLLKIENLPTASGENIVTINSKMSLPSHSSQSYFPRPS